MWHIAGLTFHWYGLILGLAIAVGWLSITVAAHRQHLEIRFLENSLVWLVIGGVIGARVYHLLTDWSYYQGQWITALYIWRGGLSIIGAVIGGLVVLWYLIQRNPEERAHLGTYLDLCVFGLPVAQAIGRLGNWANQELYGLPTQLPWKLYIDPQHRLPGYQTIAYYHPLFAYEALALIVFAGGVWWWSYYRQRQPLGSGKLFALYLAYYAVVRFGLDFLRLDAARIFGLWLSVNQVVMLVLLGVSLFFVFAKKPDYD